MRTLQRRVSSLALSVALLIMLTSPAGAARAAESRRCFPETGRCVSGNILAYWERNGGLAIFGYPISDEQIATIEGSWSGPTQWFERDRLEDHSNEGKGVLAGRLGAQALEVAGHPWHPGIDMPYNPECTFFEQTKYNLCGAFRAYWQANGGLERFGYPIGDPYDQQIEGKSYRVQYFERRRMEYHPEYAGTPYEVLLGLLGRELYEGAGGLPSCAANINPSLRAVYLRVQLGRPLGCPVLAPGNNVPAATQAMQRGHMLWYGQATGDPMLVLNPRIFAVIAPGQSLSFRTYDDTWAAGQDPDRPDGTPPQPDLYAPWRGFGKVWSQDADLRQQIGWAREPQSRPDRADYQLFDSGIILVHLRSSGATYAFGNPDNPGEVQYIP